MGRSLWRYATPEIQRMEAALEAMAGAKRKPRPPSRFRTGANRSDEVPIRQSACRWTRIVLADGSAARHSRTL